jgi:acetylglutamate kinase
MLQIAAQRGKARIMSNPHDPAMLAKAETLIEALPYLQRYAGRTFVVKYGGHAMGDPELARDFAEDVVLLKAIGINPVVVHGGGPQIGAMLKKLGVESQFVDGLRVTDKVTAQVAEMVLSGAINKELVAWISAAGGKAIGISGKDGNMVTASKVTRTRKDPDSNIEQVVDLGFVGEPETDRTSVIETLSARGMIPVIAPIAAGADGETYNINADTMAGAIAAAIGAARLFLLTDVTGVLDKDKNLLTDLTPGDIDRLRGRDDPGRHDPQARDLRPCSARGMRGGGGARRDACRMRCCLEFFTSRGAGTLIRAG